MKYVSSIMGILIFLLFMSPVFAQTQPCPTGTQASGLVSSGTTVSNFGNEQGICVVGQNAAFVSYKIPSYADLKSIYFDQSTLPDSGSNQRKYTVAGSKTSNYFDPNNLARSSVHFISGSLTIDSDLSLPTTLQPIIVFVQNDLNFTSKFTYAKTDQNAGMVFVVGGNVYINTDVIEVDAVIITQGTICTNYTANGCPSTNLPAPPLVINGSLISLDSTKPIQFKRTLNDNSPGHPAEIVNHQPKYLVILRNLFASPLQKWSEIQ